MASTQVSVHTALPVIRGTAEDVEIDWNEALFVASLIAPDAPEIAQDGALRIAQACLQSRTATTEHQQAAQVLLSRMGNSRAIDLAVEKNLIDPISYQGYSLPIEMDLVRQKIALSIFVTADRMVSVNEFQRQFWSAAEGNDWVSVSAPTSVGKSFIVKLWLQKNLSGSNFTAVYIVPTRALIEEVSRDLRGQLSGECDVFNLPWDPKILLSERRVLVLTQERFHVLQQNIADISIDLIFVDEAQKLGDGSRGLLLQRVLDHAIAKDSSLRIIFASPLSTNPELLLQGAPSSSQAILSESVTVNQNLIHVNQVRGKPTLWQASVLVDGEAIELGFFDLPARPQPISKRLSLVAVALGAGHSGNVVYANGAADAEKFAGQIADLMPSVKASDLDPDIASLCDLIERIIHPKYLLASYLRRQVAFHYGNMPLLVREEIERLFRIGKIHYLVCTSTLLEGVNLPCQNLFVRGPKRGRNNPMTAGDFWNLAGRAGRWGVEFQGNIVCVDTEVDTVWDSIPKKRVRQPMSRSTDEALSSASDLISFISDRAPLEAARDAPLLESMVSMLAARVREGLPLSDLRWFEASGIRVEELTSILTDRLSTLTVSAAVTNRHAGISPFAIQRLADYLTEHEEPERLLLPPPESSDAAVSYVSVISRINRYLGGDFSSRPGRQFQLAILITKWMRGQPLAVLISDRVEYFRRTNSQTSIANVIRSVMNDVEQIARFEAPLYFSCYLETLYEVHADLFLSDDGPAPVPDIAMMLELGVSRMTELSMMSLGLSRTTAVELSEYIMSDDLTSEGCISWLRSANLEGLGLPALILREIHTMLEAAQVSGSSEE